MQQRRAREQEMLAAEWLVASSASHSPDNKDKDYFCFGNIKQLVAIKQLSLEQSLKEKYKEVACGVLKQC